MLIKPRVVALISPQFQSPQPANPNYVSLPRFANDSSLIQSRKRRKCQRGHPCYAAADLEIPLPDIGEDLTSFQVSHCAHSGVSPMLCWRMIILA